MHADELRVAVAIVPLRHSPHSPMRFPYLFVDGEEAPQIREPRSPGATGEGSDQNTVGWWLS